MVFVFPIYDENRTERKPYVTYALITINVVVFFIFLLQGPRAMYEGFYIYGAIPEEILHGRRLWTIFTSMFLHADIMHLAGNMVFLWIFGDNIEDTLGRKKFIIFYLVGGFFASFAHVVSTLISEYTSIVPYFVPELRVPIIGASGAISAVLGAYLVLYPYSRIRTFVLLVYIVTFASIPAYYYLGFWFLYQLLMGFTSLFGFSSTVAFWAHIGGYVYGMIIVKALGIKPLRRPRPIARTEPVTPIAAPLVIRPLVDVLVEDDRVIVLASMPGLNQKDIDIKVSDWEVTISAEYRDLRFYRQVALPVRVVPRIYNLVYHNGVLSFTLYRAF